MIGIVRLPCIGVGVTLCRDNRGCQGDFSLAIGGEVLVTSRAVIICDVTGFGAGCILSGGEGHCVTLGVDNRRCQGDFGFAIDGEVLVTSRAVIICDITGFGAGGILSRGKGHCVTLGVDNRRC